MSRRRQPVRARRGRSPSHDAPTPPTLPAGASPDIPFASANWIRFNGCHLSRPRPMLESWNGRHPVSRAHHITEATLSASRSRPPVLCHWKQCHRTPEINHGYPTIGHSGFSFCLSYFGRSCCSRSSSSAVSAIARTSNVCATGIASISSRVNHAASSASSPETSSPRSHRQRTAIRT